MESPAYISIMRIHTYLVIRVIRVSHRVAHDGFGRNLVFDRINITTTAAALLL